MKIKTKLSLGLGFLFAIILLLTGLGTYYIHRLSNDTKLITKDNYESLVYTKNMMRALDEMGIDKKSSLLKFETNLQGQEKNITERGEKEITIELRNEYKNLTLDSLNESEKNLIRQKLYQIIELNLQAIFRKNTEANTSANDAVLYMSLIGAFTVLITFSFIINFPGYIANPIRELTESIKEISKKNYSQRLHFKSNDEFGELASAFNKMAKELDDYENSNLAQIIFQKKRIETIINRMHDPIIGLDENKNILFVNGEAISILGVSENDVLGKYAPDIALHNDLLRILLNETEQSKPMKIFAENKESYFLKETLQIFAEKQIIGSVIVLKNVTQFKELDVAKTNFIATISHELKTPIASIKMGLKLLEDSRVGALNGEQKKLIENIKEDSQRLLKITSELLDLTQIETGNIQLHYNLTSPKEVVDYAYHAMKFQAEQKGISILIDIEENLPKLNIDLEKTAWVMVNFISNAIRYSPEKSKVNITVKKVADEIVFAVKDFGKGIEEKYKDKIFDKFFKVPNGEFSSGTGLGLAISKDFIESQQGKIAVESDLNEGSKFKFSFVI
ncbi:MAG TPA: histidine kinase dimerization/phospho-acceptor domain-containing protein [Cytophagaceae bacterium]|nr:histidine kinase dimerization/phospho-acceptor domain-containing protein [Cytophagaceae bacterium]